MIDNELAFAPAHQLLGLMAAGEISSLELTRLYIARIEKYNDSLNAITTHDFDAALRQAVNADTLRASNEKLPPLHGLPMSIKDALETKGLKTTSGAPEYKDHIPETDADSVSRLKQAGAIILGKSNTPYMSGDWQAYNSLFGTSNNPWDQTRTPGGSSGGAAAAVAAGLSAADIGSDIGGSIRIPAHFCGIFGHKPSYGLVSTRGHIPGKPGLLMQADLTVIGPLARSARDLELIFSVIAGANPGEKVWRLALPPARAKTPENLRVAVWADDKFSTVDTDISKAVRACGEQLRDAGAKVDFDARPALEFNEAYENYAILMHALMSSDFPAKIRASLTRRAQSLPENDKSHPAMQARGAALSYAAALGLIEKCEQMKVLWAQFFENFDVLLCPPANVTAFTHQHDPDFWARQIEVNGQKIPYGDLMHWPSLATGAHLPASVAPAGLTPEGLPVGVQIIGPYQEDMTTIAAACMIESLNGGYKSTPAPSPEQI